MVEDGALSHKINYVTFFLGDSKSQRAPKSHYWFKSYGDFAECLLDKVVKLVNGGSVINGAYPV